MNWRNTRVLVTGGASFIGSALVDALLERGAKVRVADNLSSGKIENLHPHLSEVEFVHADLLNADAVSVVVKGIDIVFPSQRPKRHRHSADRRAQTQLQTSEGEGSRSFHCSSYRLHVPSPLVPIKHRPRLIQ